MSLKKEQFLEFRKKAMQERKQRLLENANAMVPTVSHIVQALQSSQLVRGKPVPRGADCL